MDMSLVISRWNPKVQLMYSGVREPRYGSKYVMLNAPVLPSAAVSEVPNSARLVPPAGGVGATIEPVQPQGTPALNPLVQAVLSQ